MGNDSGDGTADELEVLFDAYIRDFTDYKASGCGTLVILEIKT